MSRLLVVPPLRLDESVPFAADPSDQVLELLARRPNAVVSTLAALIVERGVDKVALLEPVAGTQDGGYGAACLQALSADLTARHIALVRLAPGEDAFGTLRAHPDGSVEIGANEHIDGADVGEDDGTGRARRLHRTDAGHALLLDDEEDLGDDDVECVAFEGLVRVTVEVVVGAAIRADDILRAMHDAARRVVAQHPGRYLIVEAELVVDAAGRRLLQWPGVAEHALADARSMAAHDGLALWWDALRITRHEVPAPLFDGGPECRDALAADLLGVRAQTPAGGGRSDSTGTAAGERDAGVEGDEGGPGIDGEQGGDRDLGGSGSAAGAATSVAGHLLLPPPPAPPAFAPPPLHATRRAPVEAAPDDHVDLDAHVDLDDADPMLDDAEPSAGPVRP